MWSAPPRLRRRHFWVPLLGALTGISFCAGVEYDNDKLHVGILMPIMNVDGEIGVREQLNLAGGVLLDLELGKLHTPMKREFCVGGCGANGSDPLPVSLPIPNMHPDMLNVQLHLGDSARSPKQGARTALDFATGSPAEGVPAMNAVVGAIDDHVTQTTASILSLLQVVQVTPLSLSEVLTDKSEFPYLFRAAPSEAIAGYALWDYVQFFEWGGAHFVHEESTTGNTLRAAYQLAAEAAGRSRLSYFYAVPASQQAAGTVAESTAVQVKASTVRLVMLITSPDVGHGKHALSVFKSLGVTSPKYQLLVEGVWQAYAEVPDFDGYTGVHAISFTLNKYDPSLHLLMQTWSLMVPEDITSRLPELGSSRWWHQPDLSVLTADIFQRQPHVGVFLLHGSLNIILRAFNSMLNDNIRPPQMHGDLLKEYVRNVSFEGFGKPYFFDENQDVPDGVSFFYQAGAVHAQGLVALVLWQHFATRRSLGRIAGNFTLEAPSSDMPDGPKWGTGTFGWHVPQELVGCPPGTRVERPDPNFPGECLTCPGGHYSSDFDSPACEQCPGGSVSDEASSNCSECAPGSFAPAGVSQCTPCFAGSHAQMVGMSECQACSTGKFQDSTGRTACLDCDAGSYAPTARMAACRMCDIGTVAPLHGHSACNSCSPGMFQSVPGATACLPCRSGSFADGKGFGVCTACLKGFFQLNASSSQPCQRCPVGTYAEEAGASSCVSCPLGKTRFMGADSPRYCECPEGTYLHTAFGGRASSAEENATSAACIACNEYMEPCPGGSEPAYQKKWYHIPLGGSEVFLCASTSACPGGLLGECPAGSSGPGCADCHEGSHYWNGEKCTKCQTSNSYMILFLPLGAAAALVVTHWFGNDPLGKSISNVSEFLVLAGMTLSVFFFLGSLTALDVAWRSPMRWMLGMASLLTTALTDVHISCSLDAGQTHGFTYGVTSCGPAVVGMSCVVATVLLRASPKKVFNSFCTMVYALFLLLVLHALKPLRYVVHPSGGKSLLSMPSVFHGTPEHHELVVLGIGVLALYCVPFAVLCLWATLRVMYTRSASRRRLLLVCFRFLFYKFRPGAFYWGVVILFRNLGLAIIPSLWPEHPSIAIFALSVLSTLCAVHTACVAPWRAKWMTHADTAILCYLTFVLNLAAGWVRTDEASKGILASLVALVAAIAAFVALVFFFKLVAQMTCMGEKQRQKIRAAMQEEEDKLERSILRHSGACEFQADEVADAFDELLHHANAVISEKECAGLHSNLMELSSEKCDLKELTSVAKQIRDPEYSVQAFYEDCMHIFPELHIASKQVGGVTFGGLSAQEELQRTIGALFAIYWLCRLDMDGKRGLAFGTDPEDHHRVRSVPADITEESIKNIPWGKMSPEQRRAHLFYNFDWGLMHKLFVDAGILIKSTNKEHKEVLVVDSRSSGRLVALLSLTAYHDIMKIPELCPRVQGATYCGFKEGETILDHDLALAYVLDRFPDCFPSYRVLTEEQQQVVRFTQADMGFNAGWLVQAEGPPSALLGKLKQAILAGQANDADVAFYFTHWVTDLAGAEPTPFKGSEKFAVKFPPHVLQSLMGCFSIVSELADKTETAVYEEYLVSRWNEAAKSLGPLPEGLHRTAKLRLHCMGQQAAAELLQAFDELPKADQAILSREMASTGLADQKFSEWQQVDDELPACPFLLYYGPAWCQRVGKEYPRLALTTLARVYEMSRACFREHRSSRRSKKGLSEEPSYRTIQCGALKAVDIEALDFLGLSYVKVRKESNCEATVDIAIFDL